MKKTLISKIRKLSALLLACGLIMCSCGKEHDFEDTTVKPIGGELVCSPYLKALSDEHYYLDISMFANGMLIYNTVAMADGVIESRSNYNGSVSHTISRDGETFFLDDSHKVYFKADVTDGGLRSVINYSSAKFIGNGEEVLSTGKTCFYEDFSCETYDGRACGVKLFTDTDGSLYAIVDYDESSRIERDVAVFSADIPEGWLEIPADYTLVDEDTYFDKYYGK